MWRMFANIYLYLPLIFSNGVSKHGVEYDKLLFQRKIICNVVCEEGLQISIYIYSLIFAIGEKRHVVEYDKLRFLPVIICNAVCEECLHISIYIYSLFSQMVVTRHVVLYDKLRFQPEMISNAVCEEFLQISLYIYPLFSQMISGDMLLCMINTDFTQKSFLMLYVKNVCKYLFIFTPNYLKWCLKRHVVDVW